MTKLENNEFTTGPGTIVVGLFRQSGGCGASDSASEGAGLSRESDRRRDQGSTTTEGTSRGNRHPGRRGCRNRRPRGRRAGWCDRTSHWCRRPGTPWSWPHHRKRYPGVDAGRCWHRCRRGGTARCAGRNGSSRGRCTAVRPGIQGGWHPGDGERRRTDGGSSQLPLTRAEPILAHWREPSKLTPSPGGETSAVIDTTRAIRVRSAVCLESDTSVSRTLRPEGGDFLRLRATGILRHAFNVVPSTWRP